MTTHVKPRGSVLTKTVKEGYADFAWLRADCTGTMIAFGICHRWLTSIAVHTKLWGTLWYFRMMVFSVIFCERIWKNSTLVMFILRLTKISRHSQHQRRSVNDPTNIVSFLLNRISIATSLYVLQCRQPKYFPHVPQYSSDFGVYHRLYFAKLGSFIW